MEPNKLRDYYTILGVDKNSLFAEIKIAYRNLSKKWHPDISKEPNALEYFPVIVESYDILSNEISKQIYDKESSYGKDYKSINELSDFEFSNSNYEYEKLKDTIEKHRKEMIDILLVLDKFSDTITYNRLIHCNHCDGSGTDKDNLLECYICRGEGKSPNGRDCIMCEGVGFIKSEDCDTCYSTGMVNNTQCAMCKGSGRLQLSKCKHCKEGSIEKRETIKLDIDSFEDNKLKIEHKGNSSKYYTGKVGSLFIRINI